jgi:diguanylate cyclase (GGDEF)-like protein
MTLLHLSSIDIIAKLYTALTVGLTLVLLVVCARLAVRLVQCRARGSRLRILLAACAVLLALAATGAYDAINNALERPELPITTSAWLGNLAALIMACWFEVFGRYMLDKARLEEQLANLANYDDLTGVFNRRAFMAKGSHLVASSRRYSHPLAAVMIDLDHFKRINDNHGHSAGDEVLRQFCVVVASCLRNVDVFGRLGGEEFCILMPDTKSAGAVNAAQRIRRTVETAPIAWSGADIGITASMGCSVWQQGGSLEGLLQAADEALYRAKEGGRNQVALAGANAGRSASWHR